MHFRVSHVYSPAVAAEEDGSWNSVQVVELGRVSWVKERRKSIRLCFGFMAEWSVLIHLLGLLNMSSIRLVTKKPPKMLIDEMKAALAAKVWAVLEGK